MDKQKSNRYLFIRCNSEEAAHDFLVNWKYDGYFEIIDGVVINSDEENLSEQIGNVLAGVKYGILIPLLDYKVVTWDYRVLSKEEVEDFKI